MIIITKSSKWLRFALLFSMASVLVSAIEIFEGDIAWDQYKNVQHLNRKSPTFRYTTQPRREYLSFVQLWPDGRVPYVIRENDFSPLILNIIRHAMADFERHTCVRFEPRSAHDNDFVQILSDGACYSFLGRTGGEQHVSLSSSCLNHGVVLHELMHATGFAHEHNRADRDKYVDVSWQNVLPDKIAFFAKYDKNDPMGLNMPYDYASLMHYGGRAFTKNGLATLVPRQANVRIGQRVGFSKLDVERINKLYNCSVAVNNKPEPAPAVNLDGGTKPLQPTVLPNFLNVFAPRQQLQTQLLIKTTTPQPPPCEDTRTDCKYLKDINYCTTLAQFMRVYCGRTCELCQPATSAPITTTTIQPPITLFPNFQPMVTTLRNSFLITDTPPTLNRGAFCHEEKPRLCTDMIQRGFCDQKWFQLKCPRTCNVAECVNVPLVQNITQPKTTANGAEFDATQFSPELVRSLLLQVNQNRGGQVVPIGSQQITSNQVPERKSTVPFSLFGQPLTGTTQLLQQPLVTDCHDRRADCAELLLKGECRLQRERMILECARMCGFCDLQTQLLRYIQILSVSPNTGTVRVPGLQQQPYQLINPTGLTTGTGVIGVPSSNIVQLQQITAGTRCEDARPDCGSFASLKMCYLWPDWMARYCPVSCNFCILYQGGAIDQCFDRRPDCAVLTRSFYCAINPEWMRTWCAASCRFCTTNFG